MQKLVLVYNPVSGDALFKYKLDDIIMRFMERGCIIVPYRTAKAYTYERFAGFVECIKPDGVLVAGGDGTVHEVVNYLLQGEIDLPIGIIASGTSNDFASFMSIEKFENYIDTICSGHYINVDVGRIGDRYFFNVASAGVLTSVAHRVDVGLKNALGKMAYYLKGLGELPAFQSVDMKIVADGTVYQGKAFLFVIVNSGTVGSLKNIAVNARVDDGKLDMIILKHCSIPELMTLVLEIITGNDITKRSNVIYLQAKNIRIETTKPMESDLDGELGPQLPLEVEAVPGRLKLFYDRTALERQLR